MVGMKLGSVDEVGKTVGAVLGGALTLGLEFRETLGTKDGFPLGW